MGVMECPELVEIGMEMAKRCRGLPLAIKTLSSLMSYKHEVQKWLSILEEKNIWEYLTAKNDVLPILRLSYDHLPLHMKQCFAFCAVFPKDHEMNKERLIQFWMANGFIPAIGPGSLELKGNDIFNDLSWRSFFQEVRQVVPSSVSEGGYPSQTICKMHDLMHDLARLVAGGECLSQLKLSGQQNISDVDVRHISLNNIPLDINEVMDCFPSSRSLISSRSYSNYVKSIGFLKPNALRILQLDAVDLIQRTSVTPEKMKHLRYLEILDRNIEFLPEAVSNLYLLHTLRLSGCWNLRKLPEGMRYMSSLRHLYIEECCNLKSMPSGLGQLRCLQKLTTYIIGTNAGNSIAELKNLNLNGELHIYNLSVVGDAADAREANLIAKQNLDDLLLCWGDPNDYDDTTNNIAESNSTEVMQCNPVEVLDALKPSNNLKILGVRFYKGDTFPVWTTEYYMLKNLIELRIWVCRECIKVPPVEKLPFLKILELSHLDKLRYLYNSPSMSAECGEEAQIVFPSLEELLLSEMPNLCSWCEGEAAEETSLVFPKLKRLDVVNCPRLTAMPTVPLLQKLAIAGNRALSCFAIRLTTLQKLELSIECHDREAEGPTESLSFQPWESLEKLCLAGYNNIVPIGANGEVKQIMTKCRILKIASCNIFLSHIPSNPSFWFWNCFTFLEQVYIQECDSLIYWPEEEFRSLTCVTFIFVSYCQKFIGSQPESSVGRSTTEVVLPILRLLNIVGCPNLIEIPNIPISIQHLYISSCSILECLPAWLGSLIALKSLSIVLCESFRSLPSSLGGLTSLEDLYINDCPNMVCLREGMEGIKALKELRIIKCPKIRILPEGLSQQLKNLDKLWIEGCPHLERHFRKFGKYRNLISEIRVTKIGVERSSGILKDLLALVPSCKISCMSSQS